MTMIKVNQVLGQVTIMVVVYSVVAIFDGVINRKFDNDLTGINRQPFLFRQFKRMNIKLKTQNLFAHPIVKLRRGFRKLSALIRWRRNCNKIEDSINQNPHKRKYYLSLVFWVILHIMIFFMVIDHSNEDSQLPTFQGLVCFFNPRTNRCRNDQEWFLIRILYFFPMIFVFISSMQISLGSRTLSSRVTSFSIPEKIGYSIRKNIPFGRELGMAMDYLANKSSLQFKHRLIYDDISITLRDAKFNEIAREKTGFGRKDMKV
jgi:hypothetical protein